MTNGSQFLGNYQELRVPTRPKVKKFFGRVRYLPNKGGLVKSPLPETRFQPGGPSRRER